MKCRVVFSVLFFLLSATDADAVSVNAKKKYPYPLLTEDYGILSDNDIGAYSWGLKPRPFNPDKDSGGYTYWQCFPRKWLHITLEDEGDSSEDFGWRDTIGNLKIRVWVKSDLVYQYEMRAARTVRDFEERFTKWRKLMKGEKYVCLAGNYGSRRKVVENGKTREIYAWTFEKLKTKKGCDSYFDSCNPTYERYLRER